MIETGHILVAFFSLSLIMVMVVGLVHIKALTRFITILFSAMHLGFTFFAGCTWGIRFLAFSPLIRSAYCCLSVLSLLTVTTVYHGFIYVRDDNPRTYSIYHAALIALVFAMTGAYLANGMTVVWIFVEATTLAVAGTHLP